MGAAAKRHAAPFFRWRAVQIQDAGEGIAAPNRALRAGQQLGATNAGGIQCAEIELRAGRWVVDRNAVDQHEQVVGLGAAQSRLRQRTAVARGG